MARNHAWEEELSRVAGSPVWTTLKAKKFQGEPVIWASPNIVKLLSRSLTRFPELIPRGKSLMTFGRAKGREHI